MNTDATNKLTSTRHDQLVACMTVLHLVTAIETLDKLWSRPPPQTAWGVPAAGGALARHLSTDLRAILPTLETRTPIVPIDHQSRRTNDAGK